MDDDIPYLLLTPGPATTTKTVKQVMMQDYCTWDNDYNCICNDIRQRLVRLAEGDDACTRIQYWPPGSACSRTISPGA